MRQPPELLIVSLPKAIPRSQPRPVPLSASDTSPLVMTCAFADFTAPACASAETYEPSSSLHARHGRELAVAVLDRRFADRQSAALGAQLDVH